MQEVERAVERVIQTIHENYGEQLTIDDMARTAMYSKFHFTRIFQRVTGLTPGRFLSAVRLQKAKQLLTSTSLKVTDISHMVGYTSVGTFSSRFGYSVGVPPTTYRQLGGFRPWSTVDGVGGADTGGQRNGGTEGRAAIRGSVAFATADRSTPIFVGLFRERIPQGQPVRCAVLPGPGAFTLEDVPQGTWYVMACAEVSTDRQGTTAAAAGGRPSYVNGHPMLANPMLANPMLAGRNVVLAPDQALSVGVNGPIAVRPDTVRLADVRLRQLGALDPPLLLALPDMRPAALAARTGSAA